MQQVDANNGTLATISPDGTYGAVTAFDYTVNATTTDDDALSALFGNNTTGGGVAVTVYGRTFIYGTSTNENFGRAELTIDGNGAPQLSSLTYSADNQSNGIFRQTDGSIDVVTGATTIKAVQDIGDGNKYLIIGNAANWQFVRVNSDGTLSAASDLENNATTNVDSLNGSLGYVPVNDLPVVSYEVNGTTYKGLGDANWCCCGRALVVL